MVLSVSEYANKLGVSRGAAYKRVRSGNIGAFRAGSQWVVPEAAIVAPKPSSRSMAPENARRLLAALSGCRVDIDDPVARRRIAEKVEQIGEDGFDIRRLWSWVRARSPRLELSASPADVADLLADSRLVPSGIADPRAGISASGVVEGYVSPVDIDDLIRDYLLVESERPNVWLHVADVPGDASGRVPLGFIVADLLDHGGPREQSQAANLLAAAAG